MTRRQILDIIHDSGEHPGLPKGLEPAIKFTAPDWTTYDSFSWWQPGKRWINSPDNHFDPTTCTNGGLHVANTIAAAQSGGARANHCLYVGVKPSEAGEWERGKRKARRVYVAGPIDLLGILRTQGVNADLGGAYLEGAYLGGADLRGADLRVADLRGADLRVADLRDADLGGAYLRGADLGRADLGGADLGRAYGRSDWDDLVKRGAIR